MHFRFAFLPMTILKAKVKVTHFRCEYCINSKIANVTTDIKKELLYAISISMFNFDNKAH